MKHFKNAIVMAKELLPGIKIEDEMLKLIAQICIDMAVDGHRADIAMMKTAATIAAYHQRNEVTEGDVKEAAELVLPHRMRRKPFSDQKMEKEKLDQSMQKHKEQKQKQKQHEHDHKQEQNPQDQVPDTSETFFEEGEPFKVNQTALKNAIRDSTRRSGSGRRSKTITGEGRHVKSIIPGGKVTDLAFEATFRAAAPHQMNREKGELAIRIEKSDLREKVREKKIGNTLLFVVDASGSMGAQARMTAAKGAVLSLLIDAYQKRDTVGLVAFKGNNAEVLLPPTERGTCQEISHELGAKYLKLEELRAQDIVDGIRDIGM